MQLPNPPPIYLDYHATTPVDPRVAAVVLHTMTTAFGNVNSAEHVYGETAAALVADVRREVAALVEVAPEGVHFTSGSSESIRLALAHAVAVHECRGDVTVRWLPVDGRARLDMTALEAACHDGMDLVCVMAANNGVPAVMEQ